MAVPDERAIVPWVPPHMRGEAATKKRDADEAIAEARQREAAARLAVAKTTETNARVLLRSAEFVLSQLEKWMRMADSEDFANSAGPVDPAHILKLAEMAQKYHRLETGQATEHVAVAVRGSVDFSKLSQDERDRWKELAVKMGGETEE